MRCRRQLRRWVDVLRDGQLLVLRSTVYPGTTALVEATVAELGKSVDVAFCPERIAEGKAMTELFELPQIVSSRQPGALDRAEKLFGNLASQMVRMEPEEAELAKLFTNTWRYIRFATANQLFMMANDFGLDYERIRAGLTFDYPRASDLPGAGFAAGPCLLKDTMQLAAFNNNNFVLGHAAMMVNEGLPLYMVSRLERTYPLSTMTVGLLGMSFKAESDDIRSSLSYKLKRLLRFKAKEVLCHDPHVTVDLNLSPLEEVLERSDLLILSTPHRDIPGAAGGRATGRHLGNLGERNRPVKPQVSVIVLAHNEGETIVPCLERILVSIQLPCEVLVVYDSPDDTTVPWIEKCQRTDSRVTPVLNLYGKGPARAIRFGFAQAAADVAVVTMADGCDDPMQIDTLARLVDRGVAIAAASRYIRGGRQIGGPFMKSSMSRIAGLSLHLLARVGTRDAHELLQGLLDRVRPLSGHRFRRGVRGRPRTGGKGPAAPPSRGRDPDDLAGAHERAVQLQAAEVAPPLSAVVPIRLRFQALSRGSSQRSRPSPMRSLSNCVTNPSRTSSRSTTAQGECE